MNTMYKVFISSLSDGCSNINYVLQKASSKEEAMKIVEASIDKNTEAVEDAVLADECDCSEDIPGLPF